MRSWQPLAAGAVVAVAVAALWARPATREVLRGQSHALMGGNQPLSPWVVMGYSSTWRRQRTATANAPAPTDYLGRLAGGMVRNPTTALERLGVLAGKYPDNPAPRAHLLWQAQRAGIALTRQEALTDNVGMPADAAQAMHDAALEPFLRTAAIGERLDPGNGYFPLMRAAALLETRRDGEAIAALERAAACTRYDDYEAERRAARRRANERLLGDLSTPYRLILDERGPPSVTSLETAVATTVTRLAAAAESGGDVARGWRMRRAVLRCAALIRARTSTMRGATTAAAMTLAAISRAGGSETQAPTTGERGERARQRAAAEFDAWLRRAGYGREAAWVAAEVDACLQVWRIAGRTGHHHGLAYWQLPFLLGQPVRAFAAAWMAAVALLAVTVWLLAAAGAAAFAAARNGAARAVVIAGASVAGILVCGLVAWVSRDVLVRAALGALSPDRWAISQPPVLHALAYALAAMALPACVTAVVALTPVARGTHRLTRLSRALTTAGLLATAGYVGLALVTAERSRALDRSLEAFLAAEGPYLAAQVGAAWPPPSGPYPLPDARQPGGLTGAPGEAEDRARHR